MKPIEDPQKTTKPLPKVAKPPRPIQQSQIDLERSEGEGMGQGRFQPEVEPTPVEGEPTSPK